MKRDSFIFHRYFFKALCGLKPAERCELYDAICELALNDNRVELSKPFLDSLLELIAW